MRASLLCSFVLFTACTDAGSPPDLGGPADLAGDGKMDGGPGIEVQARIAGGDNVDAMLTAAMPRLGYVFYAAQDEKVTVEVTHGGSEQGLDTMLKVYGPRLQDGTYPKTLAADDDSGYGKLSKIKELHAPYSGFYLVELTFGPSQAPSDGHNARLALTCDQGCTTTAPIVPMDEGLKWYRRSAERRVDTIQAYGLATMKLNEKVAAGVPASWAVVLDVDETTLNNSEYQKERLDLGVGFSLGSWNAWVNRKEALAIDGVAGFTAAVKAAGGTVALVTNRLAAGQCDPTETNLQAVGVAYDIILCQDGPSDKNPRFQALEAGTAKPGFAAVTTIMYVGDNILDFPNLTQDLRKQDATAFSQFGDTFIHLPNPMYGSFDKNTDDD
jgi:5'-nucleotidase (lipoprotein e(P4) family)